MSPSMRNRSCSSRGRALEPDVDFEAANGLAGASGMQAKSAVSALIGYTLVGAGRQAVTFRPRRSHALARSTSLCPSRRRRFIDPFRAGRAARRGCRRVLAAPAAVAQETTSSLSGFVVGADGLPVPGATVIDRAHSDGHRRIDDDQCERRVHRDGLRVGGPYRVTAQAEGMQEATVEDLFTRLAERSSVTLVAQPIAQLAGVEVTGSSERDVSIGAASRYGAGSKELPSISRDIKDVVRIDPKAWVDPTNSDALEIAGVNNRYNTITVDGVRQSDDFGLNNNGYPTSAARCRSMRSRPFPCCRRRSRWSTPSSAVDHQHGHQVRHQRVHGLGVLLQGRRQPARRQDQGHRGRSRVRRGDLRRHARRPDRRGQLFFFLSYEKLEREAPQDIGATGSGFPVEVPNVSQADYDRIRQIGLDVYGFDVGQTLASAPEEDEKILAKLDWNINESNRASLSYQRTEGNELVVNTTNNNPSLARLGAPSNWYDRAILMETASLQLFSDWNEIFSTELKLARKEVDTAQVSLFGTDFGEMSSRRRTAARSTSVPDEFATPTSSPTTSTRSS